MRGMRDRSQPLTYRPLSKMVCLEYPDNSEYPNCLAYCGTYWEDKLYNFFDGNEYVCEIDTNVGMTNVAIYVGFKYDTPDEVVKEICEQAIQMIEKAKQPKFKVGEGTFFATGQRDFMVYNHQKVTIQRILTDDECDIDMVGFKYEVKACDGNVFEAFEDDLY